MESCFLEMFVVPDKSVLSLQAIGMKAGEQEVQRSLGIFLVLEQLEVFFECKCCIGPVNRDAISGLRGVR
jgi:hypothetical protein